MHIIVLAVVLGLSSAAYGQAMTAEQQAACRADYDKFCKGTMPGGGRIIACLEKQNDKLSADCKRVVADAKKQQ